MKLRITFILFIGFLFIQAVPFIMDGFVDLNQLYNYQDQDIPDYIRNNTTPADNQLQDEVATLGRVLFYDKKLSLNETISCANCHKQEFAFGDTSIVSKGFDGRPTDRHSIRLINISHGDMPNVFWDARAETLEEQPSMTLSNSIEMGFSGLDGQPRLDSLLRRLDKVDYYEDLFEFAYGDKTITTDRIDKALAQFVRSIVSFDSKFDQGLALNGGSTFAELPNLTALENYGRSLFFSPFPRIIAPFEPLPDSVQFFGCGNCHTGPNLSQSSAFEGNNGVTGVAGDSLATDFTAIRSPSLRNMFTPAGDEIGPFMHDGSLADMDAVLEHYTFIPFDSLNTNQSIGVGGLPFDSRRPMSDHQVLGLKAFMKTFTGSNVFTDPKWSDPFDADDQLVIIPVCNGGPDSSLWNISLCEGEEFDGYSMTGTYMDTFTASNGCDSVRTLILEVLPGVASFEAVTICEGDEYNGFLLEGTYEQLLTASNGCDSIHTLELTVLEMTHPDCEMVSTSNITGSDIKVFPNPASDLINIQSPYNHSYHICIYNTAGSKVMMSRVNGHHNKLDVSHLPPGYLIVEITDLESGDKNIVKLIKS